MHRTTSHKTQYRCKDVQASFLKHRAVLVAEALEAGAKVISDDGMHFYAETFNACKQRIVWHAGVKGMPYVNGPSCTRFEGAQEYAHIFLPKE